MSELSTTNGGRVPEASSRWLELQRGNSVSQTEFWSKEPAYHEVQQSGDVTDQWRRRPASRPVESRLDQCHGHSRRQWQPPYYSNVTALRSGLCYRKSVCLSSVVYLSACLSATLVHRTQGVEPFGNISPALCTIATLWPPCQILWRLSQGNLSVGGVNRKRCSKIERWWTYRRLYLIHGARYGLGYS